MSQGRIELTKLNREALSHRALRAFQEAVRFARMEHAKANRPFYVLKDGRVVDYFRARRRSPKRKAA